MVAGWTLPGNNLHPLKLAVQDHNITSRAIYLEKYNLLDHVNLKCHSDQNTLRLIMALYSKIRGNLKQKNNTQYIYTACIF